MVGLPKKEVKSKRTTADVCEKGNGQTTNQTGNSQELWILNQFFKKRWET